MTKKYRNKNTATINKKSTKTFFDPWTWPWVISIILLLTCIAYWPSLDNGLTNWDDEIYVVDNPVIQQLSVQNIKTMFTGAVVDNYFPLTMLSLAFNYALGGADATSYHWLNLLLHLLNTCLVFYFIWQLSKQKMMVATLVALGFALHPMHVESVAWVAERKDVLYAAFFLGGLITYLKYLNSPKKSLYYALTCLLFIGSLLSKPAAVVFPIILWLIDYYWQRKWQLSVVIEKLPMLALSIVFGLITIQVQNDLAIGEISQYSLWQKIAFASYGTMAYIVKMVAPFNLSALYPYPITQASETLPFLFNCAPFVLVAISAMVIWSLKHTRLIAFGLAFYWINIALVLQFVSVGNAIIADRYTYLSYIGLLFIVANAVYYVWQQDDSRYQKVRPIISLLVGIGLLVGLVGTFQRCKIWKNSETLWSDAINSDPSNTLAYTKRGLHYYSTKNYPKALNDYNKAIELNATYHLPYANRGMVFFKNNMYDKALNDYNKAIELNPNYYMTYNNRGHLQYTLQENDKALNDYNKCIELNPNYYMVYNNKAIIHHINQNYNEALDNYNKALSLRPNYQSALKNRTQLYQDMKQ